MEANTKDGKVKFTFEVEINPAAMEMLKMQLDMMEKWVPKLWICGVKECAREEKCGRVGTEWA